MLSGRMGDDAATSTGRKWFAPAGGMVPRKADQKVEMFHSPLHSARRSGSTVVTVPGITIAPPSWRRMRRLLIHSTLNPSFPGRALVPASMLLVGLVFAGCSPKPGGDTEGDSDTSTSTGGTDGASATSATDATTTLPTTSMSTDDSATEDSGTASSATIGMTATATSDTTGEPGDPLTEACLAFCQRTDECVSEDDQSLDECTRKCAGGFGGAPPCSDAAAAFWGCAAKLSCEDLTEFEDHCIKELGAVDLVCVECGMSIKGGGGTCSISRDCGELQQEYECDANKCACIANGLPGKTCPAEGFCGLDSDAQAAAAQACCGWAWP